MRDITPPVSSEWDRVEAAAREIFSTFGYGEIRLPILEQTDLFARAVGSETDIVGKEMFPVDASEVPELKALAQSILASVPRALDEVLKTVFQPLTSHFSKLVAVALEQGTIPRTAENSNLSFTLTQSDAALSRAISRLDWQEAQPSVSAIVAAVTQMKLGDDLSLRPEATASVCRAYIEHGMQTLPGNVKLYYIGPMFRRERPQKGRYRQFYQIGAEVLGQSDAPGIDAELIEMLLAFFAKTGLEGAALAVNSIGCKNCRPKYVEILREELRNVKDQLGADSQRRIETNPLRVLDSKIPDEQPIIEKLPRISDHLCEDCRAHFAELERQLALRNISYERNWRLVRGLDYYTRTTFEITAPGLGSQNAVCGGGRYDGLVELLGGPPTKGIGFAIGTDRLMMSLEAQGKLKTQPAIDVFIVWMGAAAERVATQLARRLRDAGVKVELPATEMKLGKALGLGDKLGARYGLIIGDNEVASQRFTLKRLADAQQQSLSEQELLAVLKASL